MYLKSQCYFWTGTCHPSSELHSSGITVEKKRKNFWKLLLAASGQQLQTPQALQRPLLEGSGHYLDCSMFFNLAGQCLVFSPFMKRRKYAWAKRKNVTCTHFPITENDCYQQCVIFHSTPLSGFQKNAYVRASGQNRIFPLQGSFLFWTLCFSFKTVFTGHSFQFCVTLA